MPWVLVDIAVPLLAVLLFVLAVLSLWKHVKALLAAGRSASDKVGHATDALAAAQAASPHAGAYPGGTSSKEHS